MKTLMAFAAMAGAQQFYPHYQNDGFLNFMPQGNPFRHKFAIGNQRQYRKRVRQNQWLLNSKKHRSKN